MKMTKKTILSIPLLAVLLFPGCSQDDTITSGSDTAKNEGTIRFTPMEIKTLTRGSQTTTASLSSYSVSCSKCALASSYASVACGSFFFNETIDAATGESGYYWPSPDYKLSFFAYAPNNNGNLNIGSRNKTGYPEYTYTVPSTIGSQVDFITADVLNMEKPDNYDPIPLTFNHQCADVCFRVYNQGTSAITVHSIAICGIKYSGTFCEGNSPKWSLSNTVSSFTLSLGTSVAAKETLDATGTANHFIMLPQTVASGTQIFDVDATVSGVRKHYYHTLTAAQDFDAGYSYTFTLILGVGEIIVDPETEITPWEVETKYLSVSGVSCPTNTYTQPTVTDGEVLGVDNWEKIPRYFQFKAVNAGTFQFSKAGLSYSTDMGQTWTALAANTATPSIAANSYIFWKSNTAMTPTESEGIGTFSATGTFDAYGNIMSLLYGDNGDEQTSLSAYSYAFTNLFKDNTYLRKGRYMSMPATTLSEKCYNGMFKGCTNMTNAPELPATALATGCYNEMFKGCSSLKYIKALFLTTPSDTYTADWVNGVASDGTFVKNSSASWNVTGNNGIPSSWTVETE